MSFKLTNFYIETSADIVENITLIKDNKKAILGENRFKSIGNSVITIPSLKDFSTKYKKSESLVASLQVVRTEACNIRLLAFDRYNDKRLILYIEDNSFVLSKNFRITRPFIILNSLVKQKLWYPNKLYFQIYKTLEKFGVKSKILQVSTMKNSIGDNYIVFDMSPSYSKALQNLFRI